MIWTGFWFLQRSFLGKFQLKTAQTFVIYRINYRRWDQLFEILVWFPFQTHLQIYASPRDLARILNLADKVFLGKFQLKTTQTYWQFFLSNWYGNLKSNFDLLYKGVCYVPKNRLCSLVSCILNNIKTQKAAFSLEAHAGFCRLSEGEIWCLFTVTFGEKVDFHIIATL